MRALLGCGKEWRNYLYANSSAFHNDVDDFLIRVQLISDSHAEILATMMLDEPNMGLVKECLVEIQYQTNVLSDMINEFIEYANPHEGIELSANELIDGLCKHGTDDYLYQVADDWKEFGEKANKLCSKLNDKHSNVLNYIQDDLCKLILDDFC